MGGLALQRRTRPDDYTRANGEPMGGAPGAVPLARTPRYHATPASPIQRTVGVSSCPANPIVPAAPDAATLARRLLA